MAHKLLHNLSPQVRFNLARSTRIESARQIKDEDADVKMITLNTLGSEKKGDKNFGGTIMNA